MTRVALDYFGQAHAQLINALNDHDISVEQILALATAVAEAPQERRFLIIVREEEGEYQRVVEIG